VSLRAEARKDASFLFLFLTDLKAAISSWGSQLVRHVKDDKFDYVNTLRFGGSSESS
jgi:hypothetical protein